MDGCLVRHKRTCRGNGTRKTQFYDGLNQKSSTQLLRFIHHIKKRKKNNIELINNGRYGSRKKGTYFQIMDDFLNFFKTSLFWSPIRGCSLKQRLKEKKHSCSNTISAVAVQKNLPQKSHNGSHQKSKQSKQCSKARSHWLRGLLAVLTSHSCRGRSSNRCCSSRAGYRACVMMSDRAPEVHKLFHNPVTLGRLLALTHGVSLYNFMAALTGHAHTLRMNSSYFCQHKVKYVFLTSRSDAVSLEW